MSRHRQLSIALDDNLRERLEKLATSTGRSLADEIRYRLELALHLEGEFDRETRELGYDLMSLARDVRLHSEVPWHAHPKAHEALIEAVATWLDGVKPKPPPSVDPLEDPWGADDPQTAGRTLARSRLIRKDAASMLVPWDPIRERPVFFTAQKIRGRRGRTKA